MVLQRLPWIHLIKFSLLLLLCYFLFWYLKDTREELFLNPVHFFDDAYMFIRYAKYWHLGYGEVWNRGESPVYGNTSQLHFLVILALTALPNIADDVVIKWSSFVPSFILLLYLPCVAVRHGRLFKGHAVMMQYLLWSALLLPLWYWNTPFAYHAYTGMDTALSALLLLAVIDCTLVLERHPTVLLRCTLALLMLLAFETRPENILACALFVLLYLGFVHQRRRDVIAVASVVAGLLLVDAAWKYWYFGDVLPLAFYTKSSGFFEGFAGKFHNHALLPVFYALLCVMPFLAAIIFSFRLQHWRLLLAFMLPVICVTAYFFTMLNIMNLYARYEYPLMVFVVAAAIVLADVHLFHPGQWKKLSVAAAVALGLYLAFGWANSQAGNWVRMLLSDSEFAGTCDNGVLNYPLELPSPVRYSWKDKMFQMTDTFHDAPPGTSVVTTEHGYFGAKNLQITIIDVSGLHNRDMAHYCFSAAKILAQKPDVIWLPHWHYTCLNHKLVFNDEFRQHYKLYPGLFNLGIALRTDSPRYEVLYQLVEHKVQEIYPGHHLANYEQRP